MSDMAFFLYTHIYELLFATRSNQQNGFYILTKSIFKATLFYITILLSFHRKSLCCILNDIVILLSNEMR